MKKVRDGAIMVLDHDGHRSFICDAVELAPQSDPDAATNLGLLPPAFAGSTQNRLYCSRHLPSRSFFKETVMETILPRCCGLDVHKDSIQACVRLLDERGKLTSEVRSFSTMTADLLALGDWLAESGVTHAAMESTGVYWKPAWNLLEDRFTLLLVNARHIKHVPGRKTDVLDCQWIAQLLQHGLLAGSFVPPISIRQARDLTRHRTQLVAEKTRVANRIQKVLEDTNVKLASVASDILGKSCRAMLAAMIDGEKDPQTLAGLALGRLQSKQRQLLAALRGKVTEHHRFMLKLLVDQLQGLEQLIARIEQKIDEVMAPLSRQVLQLDDVPGIDHRAAHSILAEIGADMSRFPSSEHLCSWAGMCPGNHESAGKRKKGTTRPGNRWLRATLTQCAWAASHTKGTYLSSQYRRLASRRGRKKALIAVGRSILTMIYEMLAHQMPYAELGGDWFTQQQPLRLQRHLVKRLEALGFEVTLQPKASAA
jgi:transposase